MTCELHLDQCPNKNGGTNSQQPICSELGKSFSHRTNQDTLLRATHSKCIIERIFALVSILRRRAKSWPAKEEHEHKVWAGRNANCRATWEFFYQEVIDNYWYLLENSSIRVLMSIIDTFADVSPRLSEESGATLCSVAFRKELFAHTTMTPKNQWDNKPIWPTVSPTIPRYPDAMRQTEARIRKILFRTPAIWFIYICIMRRIINSKTSIAVYLNNFDPDVKLVNTCLKLLVPSSMNDDQRSLYSIKHQKNNRYGSRAKITPEIATNLTGTTILDFGCGKGRLNHPDYQITNYDPATIDTLPRRKFDIVLCLDVMEHVPADDLPAVYQWLEMFASKQIFLLICTRPASYKLPNGANAHATIQNKDWWAKSTRQMLRGYQVVIIPQPKSDHVLLRADKVKCEI